MAERRWIVLASIVAISVLARIAYYVEVVNGPLSAEHCWEQTDMCYFDQWAHDIASGDWLSRKMEPPLHAWHMDIAQGYFRLHPEEFARLSPADAGAVDEFFQRHPEANSAVERLLMAARQGKSPADQNPQGLEAVRKEIVAYGRLWDEWVGQKRYYQEPLYPYLIAVTYKIAGFDVRHVFLWQLCLGVLSNLLIYFIARRHFGETTAAIAGLLAALCSPLLYFEAVLLRETLIVFAGLALVWLTGEATRRRSLRWWLLTGVAMGLALTLKSQFAIFLAGTLVLLGVQCRDRFKDLVRLEVAALVGVAIGFAPLAARNVAVGVSPFATASASGINFILANANEPNATVYGTQPGRATQAILDQTGGRLLPTVVATLKSYDHGSGYLKVLWDKLLAIGHWFKPSDNTNYYFYRLHAATLRCLPVTFLILSPLAMVGLVLGFGGMWKVLLGVPGERTWCAAPHLYLLVLLNVIALLAFFVRDRFRAPDGGPNSVCRSDARRRAPLAAEPPQNGGQHGAGRCGRWRCDSAGILDGEAAADRPGRSAYGRLCRVLRVLLQPAREAGPAGGRLSSCRRSAGRFAPLRNPTQSARWQKRGSSSQFTCVAQRITGEPAGRRRHNGNSPEREIAQACLRP